MTFLTSVCCYQRGSGRAARHGSLTLYGWAPGAFVQSSKLSIVSLKRFSITIEHTYNPKNTISSTEHTHMEILKSGGETLFCFHRYGDQFVQCCVISLDRHTLGHQQQNAGLSTLHNLVAGEKWQNSALVKVIRGQVHHAVLVRR